MSSLSSTFSALSQSYTPPTPPTLPSLGTARAQAKADVSNFLTGLGTTAAGPSAAPQNAAPATAATSAKFHQLLDQAMKKSAQGMASHTASAVGVHPDQSQNPTNGQAATGHAVSIIA